MTEVLYEYISDNFCNYCKPDDSDCMDICYDQTITYISEFNNYLLSNIDYLNKKFNTINGLLRDFNIIGKEEKNIKNIITNVEYPYIDIESQNIDFNLISYNQKNTKKNKEITSYHNIIHDPFSNEIETNNFKIKIQNNKNINKLNKKIQDNVNKFNKINYKYDDLINFYNDSFKCNIVDNNKYINCDQIFGDEGYHHRTGDKKERSERRSDYINSVAISGALSSLLSNNMNEFL